MLAGCSGSVSDSYDGNSSDTIVIKLSATGDNDITGVPEDANSVKLSMKVKGVTVYDTVMPISGFKKLRRGFMYADGDQFWRNDYLPGYIDYINANCDGDTAIRANNSPYIRFRGKTVVSNSTDLDDIPKIFGKPDFYAGSHPGYYSGDRKHVMIFDDSFADAFTGGNHVGNCVVLPAIGCSHSDYSLDIAIIPNL